MDAQVIENPTRSDLVDLIGKESGSCVSTFMQKRKNCRDVALIAFRYKNLITKAIREVEVMQVQLHVIARTDLAAFAVRETLLAGGSVLSEDTDGLAAIYRF